MVSRRHFIGSVGAGISSASLAWSALPAKTPRKRMAIITNVYLMQRHGQHMGDRFLTGYPLNGTWNDPQLDVVSMYVDQKPQGDLSAQRAQEFGLTVYPSVAETLRCGGDKLAVDAVLVIGEHGEYPLSKWGQKKYPRYEYFKQIVDVFKKDGRTVPVFNDKHLSWKWEWANEMVTTAQQMNFPLMAGSSLPVTWRMPAVDMPFNAEVDEVMSLAYGGIDSYDFHALEVLQCMAERRRGGETGVATVQALQGDAVWRALEKGSFQAGGFSRELFKACLCRTQTLGQTHAGFGDRYPTVKEIRQLVPTPTMYRIQYNDGLKATMLLMNGLVKDFTFAAKLKQQPEPLSTLFYLPPQPNVQYSAILMAQAEQMFLTGKSVYPVERTLLTSGVLATAVQSLTNNFQVITTPQLNVKYTVHAESLFCRT